MDKQNLLQKYLIEGKVMQLATSVNDRPWVCSVYFVYVEGGIYWLSFPTRRHSQEIATNSWVAGTVMIKPERPVVGVELAGTAEIIQDAETVQKIMAVYVKKYDEGEKFYDNFQRGVHRHEMYRLRPHEIVLFDEMSFPGQGRQVVL